jgi:hypothetical protein
MRGGTQYVEHAMQLMRSILSLRRLAFALAIVALPMPARSVSAGSYVPPAVVALRRASTCDAWRRLGVVHIRGTHSGIGMGGAYVEVLDVRDGRYATNWRSGSFSSAQGFDGTEPWSVDFSAGTNVMNAPSAIALAVSQAWSDARGWCDGAAPVRYAMAGSARSGTGAALDVVTAWPLGGAPITLFIDRSTHLIDHTSMRFDENHQATYYSDWRTVAGAAVPFVVRVDDPEDQSSETRRMASIGRFDGAPSFAPPPTVENVTLPAGAASVSVPYVVEGSKPLVLVTIDGKGPFPFVVDTGGHFILTAQTAHAVGLQGRGAASSTNQGSVTKVGFARIRRLSIGGAILRDEVAEINPYGFAKLERGPRPPKAGWLGLEFFERFAVTFDPTRRMMTLRPLGSARPAPPGTRLPLIFAEDAPLTGCRIAGKAGVCMLDTGNAGPTIVANAWAERVGAAVQLSHAVNDGGRIVSRATVGIGPFERPDALVSYTPATIGDREPYALEAGVLNENLIDGFIATFDYKAESVWLQPAGPYVPAPFNRSGVVASKTPDGGLVIRYIIAASPASGADLRIGDLIGSVDGVSASRLSTADFVALNARPASTIAYRVIRGTKSHTVVLVLRDLLAPHGPSR